MTTPTTFDFDTLSRLSGPRVKLPVQRTPRQVHLQELQDALRIAIRPQHLIWIALWAFAASVVGSQATTLVRISPVFGLLILITFTCLTVLFIGAYAPVIERERIQRQIARLQLAYDRDNSR